VRTNQQLQEVLNALENEQARLRTIIENAPGGIVVANHHGRIILANPMAEQILGQELPVEEAADDLLRFQICQLDGTPFSRRDTIIWRSAVHGETITDQELLLFREDGQRRYLLLPAPRPSSTARARRAAQSSSSRTLPSARTASMRFRKTWRAPKCFPP